MLILLNIILIQVYINEQYQNLNLIMFQNVYLKNLIMHLLLQKK